MPILTTAVTVQFQLHSSASPAPYNMTDCAGTIYYNDNSQFDFDGWVAEDIGTPEPNGATFTLQVDDLDYVAASNVTGVANWAVTFVPRGTTTAQSPFGNNVNTITGSGATDPDNDGVFTLSVGSQTIKNSGDWDWSLMIQMTLPGGVVKCFSSDPEMEVGS